MSPRKGDELANPLFEWLIGPLVVLVVYGVLNFPVGLGYHAFGDSVRLMEFMDSNAISTLQVAASPYLLFGLFTYYFGIRVGKEVEQRRRLLDDASTRCETSVRPQNSQGDS